MYICHCIQFCYKILIHLYLYKHFKTIFNSFINCTELDLKLFRDWRNITIKLDFRKTF